MAGLAVLVYRMKGEKSIDRGQCMIMAVAWLCNNILLYNMLFYVHAIHVQ